MSRELQVRPMALRQAREFVELHHRHHGNFTVDVDAWRRQWVNRQVVTYTQAGETGASLRAAGFQLRAKLKARASWAESSVRLRAIRDPQGSGGVERVRWEG